MDQPRSGTELATWGQYETQTSLHPLKEFEIVDPEVFRDIPYAVTYGESRRVPQSHYEPDDPGLLSGNLTTDVGTLDYSYFQHEITTDRWSWIEQQQYIAASRLAQIEHHLGISSLLVFPDDKLGYIERIHDQKPPFMITTSTPGEAIVSLYDDYPVVTFTSSNPDRPLIGMIKTSYDFLQSWVPYDQYGHERQGEHYYFMKQALAKLAALGYAMTDLEFHIGPGVHFQSYPEPDQIDIPHLVRYQLSDRGYNQEFLHVPDQHVGTSRLDTAASREQFSRIGNYSRSRGYNLALIALHAA